MEEDEEDEEEGYRRRDVAPGNEEAMELCAATLSDAMEAASQRPGCAFEKARSRCERPPRKCRREATTGREVGSRVARERQQLGERADRSRRSKEAMHDERQTVALERAQVRGRCRRTGVEEDADDVRFWTETKR